MCHQSDSLRPSLCVGNFYLSDKMDLIILLWLLACRYILTCILDTTLVVMSKGLDSISTETIEK